MPFEETTSPAALRFIEPALATLRAKPPAGREWAHEIKYDGYRTQAHLRAGRPVLYTRRGYDWTDTFMGIAAGLRRLGVKNVVLDGEVVALDDRGVPDFSALRSEIAKRHSDRLVYYAFDLLAIDGEDIRPLPLLERKTRLVELLTGHGVPLLYSEHMQGDGTGLFREACGMGLEGIISKRVDAPYRSGRTDAWLKIKCGKRDSFPIIAFVEKLGAKPRRIASLYLGRWEGDRLLYAGKALSGYTLEDAQAVRERLAPLITGKSPLAVPIDKPKATWIRPDVEAEVTFASVTSDGLLREPVFKRLVDEPAGEPPRLDPSAAKGVSRINILQLLPEAVVPSHDELRRYWRKAAARALPYLARRPLKLVRSVRGTTFYHKGPLPSAPPSVNLLAVAKREGGTGKRVWIDNLEGLLGLVDMDAVELHPWNATVDDLEHPDLIVFDLDPGPGIAWSFVVNTALALRELLRSEDLDSWPKLTGGKGIHVMVPIERSLTHDEAHAYSRELAQRLADLAPDRYTLNAATGARTGRLFIDYLRNGRGTTAVGTYSPRARPGFPIAAPVSWRAIERGVAPDTYSMEKMPRGSV